MKNSITHRTISGFSLVELAIVLVLLALIVGGILTGRQLIRTAELRSITTDYHNYVGAAQIFKDKYNFMAGDLPDAIDYWGDNATKCSDGDASNNGLVGTCNGDGDGEFDVAWSGSSPGETFMFWNQLALAGYIEGSYDGIAGSDNPTHAELGRNVPAARITGTGWATRYWDATTTPLNPSDYFIDYGNFMVFGLSAVNGGPDQAVLTPTEAWDIDKKIDDGAPAKGLVIGKYYTTCARANSGTETATNLDARYRLNSDEPLCALIFRHAFD